jgi:predicted nucleotidyltransferase
MKPPPACETAMTFFDASTTADLEPVAAVVADIQRRADRLGISIMVVGAIARDILVRYQLGIDPPRITSDIDIAIAVASWADVDKLTQPLDGPPKIPHRFIVRGIEVDMIPFGKIESATRTIRWPDDHEMNVFGFKEAFRATVSVKLPGDIVVPVASLAAQSLLKLLAWHARHYDTKRDAIDLRTILGAYHEGPYFEELYSSHQELLERNDFDPMNAGAERLGRDAGALLAPSDRQRLARTFLSPDKVLSDLAADMGSISTNYPRLAAYRRGVDLTK